MIKVLVVDDHEVVRQGLRVMLGKHADLEIIGEATSGVGALKAIREVRPDVVVLDISMPGSDGLCVLKQLWREGLSSRVVILTVHEEEELLCEALQWGAAGYVPKTAPGEAVVSAIRKAYRGERILLDHQVHVVLNSFASLRKKELAREAGITEEEMGILELLAEGCTMKEIAERLHFSTISVKVKATALYRKLGAESRAEALVAAVKRGII